ncbi:MAG: RNA-binding protein, partial [Desulfurococcaceae archaeon]
MVRVRVRGIYATALSKILVDHGFQLVDVTEKIKERLSLEADETACDVTVKTTENLDELLIIGFPKPSQEVYSTLVEELKYVY